VYDLVAEAGSTEANGVRARHGGRYGDFAGFAGRRGQAVAGRFRWQLDVFPFFSSGLNVSFPVL
jgi:hypothetical protein